MIATKITQNLSTQRRGLSASDGALGLPPDSVMMPSAQSSQEEPRFSFVLKIRLNEGLSKVTSHFVLGARATRS
jgi:hypothetical protein